MPERFVYMLYDFQMRGVLGDILYEVCDAPPPGFRVEYPAPSDHLSQGEIWRDIVQPALQQAERIVAFVDLPNANVAFEIGYSLGQAHPTQVALALLRSEIPDWLQRPPFQGFSCTPMTAPSAIRRQMASEDNWLTFTRRPSSGSEVLLLCPPSGVGEGYQRAVREKTAWRVLPEHGWDLHDLPDLLKGVGAVVWLLLPHTAGQEARDGVENTALAVIAGYAEACGIPLRVFQHQAARQVVDVMARSQPLEGLAAFRSLLPGLDQELATTLRAPQTPAQPEDAYRAYYAARVQRWSDVRYDLDTHFVQLTLLRDYGPEAPGRRFQPSPGREAFRDLHAVLAHLPDPAVVVLGPPGAGKSTLLRHYELEVARAALQADTDTGLSRLTFFVPLNDYQPPQPGAPLPLPMDWLAARWARQHADLPALETLLQAGRLTLLLDALNEMPGAQDPNILQSWRSWIRVLAQDYPRGNRVLFSCRRLDYSESLSSHDELPVPQVRIEALDNDQVQAFLLAYGEEAGAALWDHLRGTPQLEVVRLPYFLKLLVQQSSTGSIPSGRAALFTGFVWQALRREVRRHNPLFDPDMLLRHDRQRLVPDGQPPPAVLPERGLLIPRLSALAWYMQQREQPRGVQQEAVQVRLAYDDALACLDHARAVDILRAGEALAVLEKDLPQDEVLFVHQLLQEYFAARRLAQTPQPDLVQQPWRAAEVVPDLQATLATLADSDPLPPLPSTGWEETTVLAAALAIQPDVFITALMVMNLPLAGRCAAQPDVRVSESLKDTVRQAMVARTQDPDADLRARIAAGLALGELGDPRFVRGQGPQGAAYLLPPCITIPGGTYRIGSDEGLEEDEAPVHEVVLAPFALGQFPVTNAEWALFMQAGGYDEERWWEGEAAQAWRRGESTAEGAKQQWRDNRQYVQAHLEESRQWPQQRRMTSQGLEHWERWVQMSDEAFETQLGAWYPPGRQTHPDFWHDDAYNHPAQPVVGICWYEARAYCAWLSAQTRLLFRLPSEVEWEAAARGVRGRRYAWGDTWDVRYANTFEAHIRRTTPIGVFPDGMTPEGLADMSGHTWEWTSSAYTEYPYNAADGREDQWPNLVRRVVRGGSWLVGHLRARGVSQSRRARRS